MVIDRNELITLRSGGKIPKRSGDHWSPEEQEELKRRFLEGDGFSELTMHFERNEIAIYQQLSKAGLLSPQCKSRNRRPKNPQRVQCPCPICSVTTCENCGKEGPNAGDIR